MGKAKTFIEFWSEIKQDDIVINLSVEFEEVNDAYISGSTGKGEPVYVSYKEVQFIDKDVTILNRDLGKDVEVEFFDQFVGYKYEIKENIENEIYD